MKDFDKPLIDLSLKGRVFPGELKEFFDIRDISKAEGSVDLDLKTVNSPWPNKKFSINDIIDLKPEASLVFNSFTLGLQNNKILFSKVNGDLRFEKSMVAKNIQFAYKGQNIKIDGEFKNLPEWLSGRAVTMHAAADVSFDRLIPETFFKDPNASRQVRSHP